jgi:hypothetical protein
MTMERATEVKVEAARRGVSVASLFEDVWQLYVRGGRSYPVDEAVDDDIKV